MSGVERINPPNELMLTIAFRCERIVDGELCGGALPHRFDGEFFRVAHCAKCGQRQNFAMDVTNHRCEGCGDGADVHVLGGAVERVDETEPARPRVLDGIDTRCVKPSLWFIPVPLAGNWCVCAEHKTLIMKDAVTWPNPPTPRLLRDDDMMLTTHVGIVENRRRCQFDTRRHADFGRRPSS